MRILLLGGYQYGYQLLRRLIDRGEAVVGVFASEEDPHEQTRYADAIESLCREHQLRVTRKGRITESDSTQLARDFQPDVIFCFGWRTIIPERVLQVAPHGVIAAHGALLPRLRGFAPASWAILLGHEEAGTTLFRLSPGMDEGEVYFQESFPLLPDDTVATVKERITAISVDLYGRYLDAAQSGSLNAVPQQHASATYACARTPGDGEIDWSASTNDIIRVVRGNSPPAPGAYTFYDNRILRILRAHAVPAPPKYEGRIPGRIVARDVLQGSVDVLTGDGVVRLEEVESEHGGLCLPGTFLKSLRDHLGLRPSLEVARLHEATQTLQASVKALHQRLEALERGKS